MLVESHSCMRGAYGRVSASLWLILQIAFCLTLKINVQGQDATPLLSLDDTLDALALDAWNVSRLS